MKPITTALATCLVALLAAASTPCAFAQKSEPGKKIMLNMGSTSTPDHTFGPAADLFEDMIRKNSSGMLDTKRMFGGVLGSETKQTSMIKDGTLEIGWLSDIGMGTVVPEISFVTLPYLFPSYEDVDKNYFNGWMGETIRQRLSAKGIHVLAWLEVDFRDFTNSKRRISKMDDFKGLKIRVPEAPVYVNFFRELGVLPTPMSITEVSTALQQGTVDGQDNGAILTNTFGFAKFQKFATKTKHSYSGAAIVINKKLWDSLSPDLQKVLQEASVAAGAKQVKENRERVETYWQKMKEGGLQVDDVSPELDAAMRKAALKVWNDKAITSKFGDDVMNRILNAKK